jgi:anti-sigma factor RsiW
MNCADLEILICDYVDGALNHADRMVVENHLAGCDACSALAADAADAVRFMERAADVEPPPQLITRILFDAPWRKGARASGAHYQPRLAGPHLFAPVAAAAGNGNGDVGAFAFAVFP